MIKRIHILGASASGTTTLAKALSEKMGYCHFDSDDYYWVTTDVPFTQIRDLEKRRELLKRDLESTSEWVLSGSLCGRQRYGNEIEENGRMYQKHKDFVEWASQYDEAGIEMRSKALHDLWLAKLPCPVLKIEGDKTVEERRDMVIRELERA